MKIKSSSHNNPSIEIPKISFQNNQKNTNVINYIYYLIFLVFENSK
jgi:hypothetical protein